MNTRAFGVLLAVVVVIGSVLLYFLVQPADVQNPSNQAGEAYSYQTQNGTVSFTLTTEDKEKIARDILAARNSGGNESEFLDDFN